MSGCPFEALGLDTTASIDEIDRQWRKLVRAVHPDKVDNMGDERAKQLNDARDRAKQMHDTFECHWARRKKEEDAKERKRTVLMCVKEIYANEYEKMGWAYMMGDYFKERMNRFSDDVRKEAEDVVEYGLGNSRKELEAAEENITQLEKEMERMKSQVYAFQSREEAYERQINTARQREAEAAKELQDAERKLRSLQAELEAKQRDVENKISIQDPEGVNFQSLPIKRKRREIFPKHEKWMDYSTKVDCFVRQKIVPVDPIKFVSTQEILEAFIRFDGENHTIDTNLLLQVMSRQLFLKFPQLIKARESKIRGYKGICLRA